MTLFYDKNLIPGSFELNSEESHHALKVLRMKVGEEVWVTNGSGLMAKAIIKEVAKNTLILETTEIFENHKKRNYYLHIAIAPTKNIDRYEWFLEKATELGIDEVTPLLCRNSERKIIKEDRLNKVIESAMKQSQKAYHPKLNPLTSFETFIANSNSKNKLIAHCVESEKHSITEDLTKNNNEILVLIGPEGDFNPNEIKLALENKLVPTTLGNERLRTETAGVYVASVYNYFFENI